MKARKVAGLDPAGPLADNAERLVRARVAELYAFVPAALDPAEVEQLHAMRIAAKRLRYLLEATAATCFGTDARRAARAARDLQDLIGEIHDCDVQLPRVLDMAAQLRAQDGQELRRRAGTANDVDGALAAGLPNAPAYGGLAALESYLRVRRAVLHDEFVEMWNALVRDEFRARLERAVTERPEPS